VATVAQYSASHAKKLKQTDSEIAAERAKSGTGMPANKHRQKAPGKLADSNGNSMPVHVFLIVPKRRGIRNNNPHHLKMQTGAIRHSSHFHSKIDKQIKRVCHNIIGSIIRNKYCKINHKKMRA